MDAEGARFIRGRRDDAAVAGASADDDRLAAVLGMIALLDRRVEGVEVAVEDRAALGHSHGHATRAPCVFASGAMKRATASPSAIAAARSERAERAEGFDVHDGVALRGGERPRAGGEAVDEEHCLDDRVLRVDGTAMFLGDHAVAVRVADQQLVVARQETDGRVHVRGGPWRARQIE